jgi:hypothetical protein
MAIWQVVRLLLQPKRPSPPSATKLVLQFTVYACFEESIGTSRRDDELTPICASKPSEYAAQSVEDNASLGRQPKTGMASGARLRKHSGERP